MHPRRSVAAVVIACLAAASSAVLAADSGRWRETGHSAIPLYDYQGVTSDPAGNFYFDGVYTGLFRTDAALKETGRTPHVIPPEVTVREGYDHLGDLSWDGTDGGRLLLPAECYYPPAGNTCGTGAFAVADPETLTWQYYVKLDPRDIAKAMWVEVDPSNRLAWTSDRNDLLAYDVRQIRAANAAPGGPLLRPVRRLRNLVPPSGVTGATFYKNRLYVAGQNAGPFQVWSIDLSTGERRLEIERSIVGESEGLDVNAALGGLLHWQIQPYNEQTLPTYGIPNGTLLHFVPRKD